MIRLLQDPEFVFRLKTAMIAMLLGRRLALSAIVKWVLLPLKRNTGLPLSALVT